MNARAELRPSDDVLAALGRSIPDGVNAKNANLRRARELLAGATSQKEYASLSDEATRAIVRDAIAARLSGMKASDLLAADFDEPLKVCGDFIQEGLTVLASSPKTGKTTLMRQAAGEVPIGGRFLGADCEKGDVLFLSLEEGPRLFRRKLQAMKIDPRAARAIDLHWEWPRGLPGCDQLEKYLETHPNVRLGVIDSLTRFRPSTTDKNTTQFQADYDILAALSGIAKKRSGLALVAIHHTRKIRSADPIDDISGTLGLAAAADAYLVLRKEGRGATLHAGGRLWDREDSDFNLIREGQRWHLQGVSDGLTDKERAVLKMITESGGMGASDLAKTLGITRQNCYYFLDALMRKGKAEKSGAFYVAIQP